MTPVYISSNICSIMKWLKGIFNVGLMDANRGNKQTKESSWQWSTSGCPGQQDNSHASPST